MLGQASPFEGVPSHASPTLTSGDSQPVSSPGISNQYASTCGYMSDGTKREQRKIRNRESARKNRALRATELKTLKKQVLDFKIENGNLKKCLATTRMAHKELATSYQEARMTIALLQEELGVLLDHKALPGGQQGGVDAAMPAGFGLGNPADLMASEQPGSGLGRLEFLPSSSGGGGGGSGLKTPSPTSRAMPSHADSPEAEDFLYGCRGNKWPHVFEEQQHDRLSQLLKQPLHTQGQHNLTSLKDWLPAFPPGSGAHLIDGPQPGPLPSRSGPNMAADKLSLDWSCLPRNV